MVHELQPFTLNYLRAVVYCMFFCAIEFQQCLVIHPDTAFHCDGWQQTA